MNDFSETGLHELLLAAIQELGFETPTPIQAQAIPHVLTSDQDLIALAQTGTGKTAAFGLPSIQRTDVSDKRPQTLILSPTRELCLQITNDLQSFAQFIDDLHIVPVYGGARIDRQIKALQRGAQIVVATPGRAKDLIERKKLLLGRIERVVLDEADEMLTMGFKDELDAILGETPAEKQVLLFSATMSREVTRISRNYMRDPQEITVAARNSGASNVEHIYYMVQARDRYEVVKRIADIHPDIYAIIFCRTRRETKEVANKLMHDGYNADALHGDLSQAQRDEVMERFRARHLQLLVATDVAARGLDVNELTHVINYNLPDSPEIYTHRSGRTGRAGNSGISIAIIHSRETRRLQDIERRSGIRFTREMVPTGADICQKQLYSLIDKIEKVQVNEKQIEPFLPAIYEKLSWLSREELIKHFVSAEFNRFLDYYKGARDINIGDRRKPREKKSPQERRQTAFARIYINLGKRNNLTAARLIGLINDTLDSSSAEIGKIEILKKFSFFEIDEAVAEQLIAGLQDRSFDRMPVFAELSERKPQAAFGPKQSFPKQKGFKKSKAGKRFKDQKNKGKGKRNKRR